MRTCRWLTHGPENLSHPRFADARQADGWSAVRERRGCNGSSQRRLIRECTGNCRWSCAKRTLGS